MISRLLARTTDLARSCCKVGWQFEAEALFVAICNARIWLKLLSGRQFERDIWVLLTAENYWEILIYTAHAISCNITSRSELSMGALSFMLHAQAALDAIPPELRTVLSSDANASLEETQIKFQSFIESERSAAYALQLDDDREDELLRDDGGDEDMADSVFGCKSSNKFGVTYSESVITGVSLNYSDLWN